MDDQSAAGTSGGKKSSRKSQAGGARAKSGTTGTKNSDAVRELKREREKTRQLKYQVELARMNAGKPGEPVAGDASARKENALRNFSKMLGGAIPKFPSDAEVPVWFDTVECLFQRYGVPQEIQAHLVYPLVASRMSYLCASLNKEEQFTFAYIKEAVLKELRLTPREYRKKIPRGD